MRTDMVWLNLYRDVSVVYEAMALSATVVRVVMMKGGVVRVNLGHSHSLGWPLAGVGNN